MKTINLRTFYFWYKQDEFLEVSDEVAEELLAGKRGEESHERGMRRNKVLSLDAGDGIETEAIACSCDNPEAVFDMMERYGSLCRALNSLPEVQGRRVEAYYLLGKNQKEIAEEEGVSERKVRESISNGLVGMKKILSEGGPICPLKCPD